MATDGSQTQPEQAAAPHYRILMIAPTSFFADYGCHVRILEEARALQKVGHRVVICTYHNGRDLPGQDIRRTVSIPWRRDYEVGSSRHKIAFDALLFFRSLGVMWRVRPDIIHAHGYEGALIGYVLSKCWRTPLVFDRQGSLTGEMVDHHFLSPDGPLYGFWRRLESTIDRISPRILTSSDHAADQLCTVVDGAKVTCVADCVNTDEFCPRPRNGAWFRHKEALGIPLQRTVIVYLGLLAEYQGTDHLLQAMEMICRQRDDVHLLIGGFPNIERYQQMACSLQIADHVTFTGRVPYREAPAMLNLGDIGVSPKLSQTEGAGKLLNYMAMALPTVAFDTEVSREYLGEYGVYARRGDAADFARCLMALIDDSERRRTLAEALRQRAAEHYAWDGAVQTILQVYATLKPELAVTIREAESADQPRPRKSSWA